MRVVVSGRRRLFDIGHTRHEARGAAAVRDEWREEAARQDFLAMRRFFDLGKGARSFGKSR